MQVTASALRAIHVRQATVQVGNAEVVASMPVDALLDRYERVRPPGNRAPDGGADGRGHRALYPTNPADS